MDNESRVYKMKSYAFNINKNPVQNIEIKIAELYGDDDDDDDDGDDVGYGLYIWPSSLILAQFLLQNQNTIISSTTTVLELGCGTGLPGVLASKFAKHVYLTDNLAKTKRLKSLLEFTLKQNGCGENVRLLHYSWGQFDEEFFQDLPKIDYLIGSDVFFDSKLFEDLVATIRFFIDFNNKSLKFYTTYEIRSTGYFMKLNYLLEKYSLQCKTLDTSELYENLSNFSLNRDYFNSHEILLFEIFSK